MKIYLGLLFQMIAFSVYASGWMEELSCNMDDTQRRVIVESHIKKSLDYLIKDLSNPENLEYKKTNEILKQGDYLNVPSYFSDYQEKILEPLIEKMKQLRSRDWNVNNRSDFNVYYNDFWDLAKTYLKFKVYVINPYIFGSQDKFSDLKVINNNADRGGAKGITIIDNKNSYVLPYIQELDGSNVNPVSFTSLTNWLGTGIYPAEMISENVFLNHTGIEKGYFTPLTFLFHDFGHNTDISERNFSDPNLSETDKIRRCEVIRKCLRELKPQNKFEKQAIFFLSYEMNFDLTKSDGNVSFFENLTKKDPKCESSSELKQLCIKSLLLQTAYDILVENMIKNNLDIYKHVCKSNNESTDLTFATKLKDKIDENKLKFIFSKKVCRWVNDQPSKAPIDKYNDEDVVNKAKELVSSVDGYYNKLVEAINSMGIKLEKKRLCNIFFKEKSPEIKNLIDHDCNSENILESAFEDLLKIINIEPKRKKIPHKKIDRKRILKPIDQFDSSFESESDSDSDSDSD